MSILYFKNVNSTILNEEEMLLVLGGKEDNEIETDEPVTNTAKCDKCEKCAIFCF